MFLPYPVPNTAIPNPQSTGYGHNPARSLPFPQPQNMPQGCWFSGAVRLPWGAPPAPIGAGINPYFRGVLWTSPIYDLRPNLRGMQPQGTTQISPGSAGNAVPMWGWSSHMLYVQISNLLSGGTEGTPGAIPAGQFLPGQNLKLLSSEWGHVSDPGKLTQVLPSTDITSQVDTNTDSSILAFRPLGESLPVRYWRLNLQLICITQAVAGAEPVPFHLDAGHY